MKRMRETVTSLSFRDSCLLLASTDWLGGEVATEMYFPPLKASRGSSCPHRASRKYFRTVTLLQSAAIACGRRWRVCAHKHRKQVHVGPGKKITVEYSVIPPDLKHVQGHLCYSKIK